MHDFLTATEFRLTIDPLGQPIKSPTVNCTPDLTRTPLRSVKRRNIVLRAPSTELKAVWQNLLTRQIFIVSSTLGSCLNSPLESPDIMISQLGDMNLMANSITSIKMCSVESINNQRNQQVSDSILMIFAFHQALPDSTKIIQLKLCHCRVRRKPTSIVS